ncbi:MAG TPA: TlpA disulfide reductase family protein [Saprospiraceae bacterium]|nr:TlpA family protein disulfide reductase [Saprospiraceae bacterium]HRO07462.1 TlpA disulfide reductase family protein [Saprospiraceae bacterium]HRP40745.1 TlpA disulfide reductase family protein [Saprospiraceae bacterium]
MINFRHALFVAVCFFVTTSIIFANNNPFPSVSIKTLDGKSVNIQEYTNNGKITVVSFWASWCTPCKRELDAIHEIYDEWVEKYDIQLLAITIDDARGLSKVPAMVKSKGWEFTVLADSKQELQRALNFQTIPQTFLLNQKGEIVYSHNGYNPGDELELEKKIADLVK